VFVAGNFIGAVAGVLETLLRLYSLIVIASAVVTWVSPDPYNPIVRFLRKATEPALGVIRRLLPAFLVGGSGIDFSPLVLVLLIMFVQRFLVGTLHSIAVRMG
jgi:YggT family protein